MTSGSDQPLQALQQVWQQYLDSLTHDPAAMQQMQGLWQFWQSLAAPAMKGYAAPHVHSHTTPGSPFAGTTTPHTPAWPPPAAAAPGDLHQLLHELERRLSSIEARLHRLEQGLTPSP